MEKENLENPNCALKPQLSAKKVDNSAICDTISTFNIKSGQAYTVHSFTKLNSIIQKGPTCGLVALTMLIGSEAKFPEIFEYAKANQFTHVGEMFSAENLAILCEKYLNCERVELYSGRIDSDYIVQFLKNDGVLLVPYDADRNHSPGFYNGIKAHWAIVCGLVEFDDGTLMVAAMQGKSKRVALWDLRQLSCSNLQLREVDPKLYNETEYKIPYGKLQMQLCGVSIQIMNLKQQH